MSKQSSSLKQDVRYNVSFYEGSFVFTPNIDVFETLPDEIVQHCIKILNEAKSDFWSFNEKYTDFCHGGDKSVRLGAIYNAIPLSDEKNYFLDIETKNEELVSFHISRNPDQSYYYGND